MPTGKSLVELLTGARDNYARQLAELSTTVKVDSTLGGRSVQWAAHQKFLVGMIADLDARIAAADPADLVTAVE